MFRGARGGIGAGSGFTFSFSLSCFVSECEPSIAEVLSVTIFFKTSMEISLENFLPPESVVVTNNLYELCLL